MAFLPCPTSICKIPGVSVKLPSAHRLFVIENAPFPSLPYVQEHVCCRLYYRVLVTMIILPRELKQTATVAVQHAYPNTY